MKLPNFKSISPSNQWVQDKSYQIPTSFIEVLVKKIKDNPKLILPHSLILASSLLLLIVNAFFAYTKSSLEPYHQQYSGLQNELNTLQSTNQELEKQYAPSYDFILKSLHIYSFAKELQRLIPRDVQLSSYSMSLSSVSLEASSVNQKSLDDFIVFLANHPLLKTDSLNILEISSSALNPAQNQQDIDFLPNSYTQQPKQIFNAKLTAQYQQPAEVQLLELASKSGDIGLLEKLRALKP